MLKLYPLQQELQEKSGVAESVVKISAWLKTTAYFIKLPRQTPLSQSALTLLLLWRRSKTSVNRGPETA